MSASAAPGLAWRLAGTLALVAAGLVTLGGWVAATWISHARERTATAEVLRRLDEVEREIARLGTETAATVERLGSSLERHERERFERLAAGGPEVVGEAERLASATGLDLLAILDRQGTVVSSKRWPQLAGLEDPSLTGLAEDRPGLRRVRGPDGTRLAVVVSHPVIAESGMLLFVGGRVIDDRFARAVAAGGAAVVWDSEAAEPAPPVARVVPADVDEPLPACGGDGTITTESWVAVCSGLRDDRGRTVAGLLLALPRDDVSPRALLPVVGSFALAAAVLAAALGVRIARRVTRPVDRLVHAVDAIAAGEADYTFPARAEHELDRLAAAFSRLQRSLERQQRRSAAAERVAAWREVARRVAHEVKNPLVPIRLTVENLARARRENPRVFDELFDEGARTILDEVEQLRRLVTEFSDFARLPSPRPRPVELHDLIDSVLELHAAEPGLVVVRAFDASPATVEADPDQIGRALKNVVGNAVDAMRETSSPPRLVIGTATDDGMVEIRVSDNGTGMPPDVVDQVFEPYFTTKPEGTGLGMAMVYRIVVEHGGEVCAVNRPEGGTTVRIRLPRAADKGEHEARR